MEAWQIPLVKCPVLVVGGRVSGYASLGDSDGTERDCDTSRDTSTKEDAKFKSEFAKELDETFSLNYLCDLTSDMPYNRFSNYQYDGILDQAVGFKKAKEDFMRVKYENAKLKFEIEKQKHEEAKYNKLEMEIEFLTSKLMKVTQNTCYL